MLFLINLNLSFMFLFMKHPLSLGMILLAQTIIIALITGNFCLNFWFSYIIFLIMIGGMLILFIYMTSIASNEKFKINLKLIITMITLTLMIMFLLNYLLFYKLNLNMLSYDMTMFNNKMIINYSMIKFISHPLNMLFTFIVLYLFFTLVAVVKISKLTSGPLRIMN
uniref:NADH-ubiquinone oxidoreductase chain 6 n=1 Tax=Tenebrionoidea sp. 5 KM-2017 TaxID=2219483 RepID=A0A346RG59_9CUCU|nr:NADH dehydrogenase subunit 6 [Tenebrionoidea sp. 5 KM-2017]